MNILHSHTFAHQIVPRYRTGSLQRLALLQSRRQHGSRRVLQQTCRASSSSADVTSRGRRRTGEQDKELPSWIPWDQDALKQQAASLIELQMDRPQLEVQDRRRSKRTFRKTFQPTYEEAVNPAEFEALKTEEGIDYAAFCNGEMQWFAVKVADPDIKKAGFVTKWLGYGAQTLGPVKKKDGTTVDREIQTWLPKKKVKAYSLRTGKMGTRTVAYLDGQVVLFRAIMDNALGEYLKAGLPDTSGVYNDRVVRNEGRITGFVEEEVGKRLFVETKTKKIVEREHVPKPCDDSYIEAVKVWLETKEVWDKEKVCMAEMGYIPDEATGWTEEPEEGAEEEAEEEGKQTPGRKSKQLDPAIRDFAEAIFEKQKREVAALDDGGWNVGNVVEPRRRRGMAPSRGRGVGTRRAPGRPQTNFRPEPYYRGDQGDSRQSSSGWSTSTPQWASADDARYSGTSGGRSGEWAAGLSDFSSLEDFADVAAATSDDGTAAWGESGYHLSDAPDRMADGDVGGWAEPEGAQPAVGPSKPAFVEALGSEDLSPSHPEDWAAADVSQDWTFSPEEEAAVAPKGWATSSSGAWVDDSAAAAGSFFERAPRTHKQAGGSGWSESGPAPDNRGAPSGEWSGSSSAQPAQAPRLSHWSKYDTVGSTEPVRGDASVRGRRRNRDAGRTDDYSEEPASPVDALPAPAKAGETGWVDKDAAAWIDSIPSPSYEWDAAGDAALPTTGNWGEWNSYISSDPEFVTGREGVPFHMDDDDLFAAVADENEEVVSEEAPLPAASVPDDRSQRRAPANKEKQQRKNNGRGGSRGSRGEDLFGDSVKVNPSDGFVEDGLGWDEMV
ncbi:hypothetical protein COCOBI_13-0950 [Coccomyxa sp. Obi]|nr:hypothetical protein COCOBI_13-0950 [Coccomyxa sp. Obi]